MGTWILLAALLGCGDKDGGSGTDSGTAGGDTGDTGTAAAPGPCEGDRLVDGSDSYAALVAEQCTSISGQLSIAGVPAVELGLLTEVGGDLLVPDVGALNTLVLPSLTAVGGAVLIDGPVLTGAELPSLATVGGDAAIHLSETSGASLALGLQAVSGDLLISGGIVTLDLDDLTTVEQLRLDGTADAPALTLASLETLGALGNDSDPMPLSRLSAPKLTSVTGSLGVGLTTGTLDLPLLERTSGALVIEGLDGGCAGASLPELFDVGAQIELRGSFSGTATLSLPKIQNTGSDVEITATGVTAVDLSGLETVGAAFSVHDTDVLATLTVPELGLVGGNLQLTDNASLPTCDAVAIVHQVDDAGGVGGATEVSGNLADECSL